MNKQDYMNELQEKLAAFPEDIRNEIVSDYEEHFRMGDMNGKSEEQICEELGSIDELVKELGAFSADKAAEAEGADGASNAAEGGESEAQPGGFKLDEEQLKKTAESIANGLNTAFMSFAGFLGSMAANVTKGTGKVANGINESSGEFASKAEEYAKTIASGVGTAFEAVVNKSTEFAKEVSDNYRKTMNKDAAEAATNTEEAVDAEFTCSEDAAENLNDSDMFDGETNDEEDTNVVASEACGSEIDSVVVEADCGEVVVVASEDGLVHCDYKNDGTVNQQLAYKFNFYQEGSTVHAEVVKRPGSSGFFKRLQAPDIELRVELPEGLKSLSVRVMSGNVSAEDISVEQLKINSMSGDIELDNVLTKNYEVTTISGDVNIEGCSTISAKVNTVSGDIDVDGGTTQNINLQSVSGDIDLNAMSTSVVTTNTISGDTDISLEDVGGFSADVKTASGNVNLAYGSQEISSVRAGEYTLGNGEVKISAVSTSGDIDINA